MSQFYGSYMIPGHHWNLKKKKHKDFFFKQFCPILFQEHYFGKWFLPLTPPSVICILTYTNYLIYYMYNDFSVSKSNIMCGYRSYYEAP